MRLKSYTRAMLVILERLPGDQKVVGSNPTWDSIFSEFETLAQKINVMLFTVFCPMFTELSSSCVEVLHDLFWPWVWKRVLTESQENSRVCATSSNCLQLRACLHEVG